MKNFAPSPLEDGEELYQHHEVIVDQNQSALRIDKFLMDKLTGITRTKIQDGIKHGWIKVNGSRTKTNYKVRPSDVLTVEMPEEPRDTIVIPEDIYLDIKYEDEDLIIINKPAGMVVHPAHNNWTGTMVNALAFHFKNLPEMRGNKGRPGLVHRIDKDTSGLLVVAKNEKAMNHLAKQFFNHSIDRTYNALVWGEPKEKKGMINANLGRSLKDRRITTVFPEGDHGRHAVTHWEVLETLRYVSLIKCELETGRTHQIRAHMKFLGHPIFSDATYGGNVIVKGTPFTKYKGFVHNCFKLIPRQALHAKSLGFIHPSTGKHLYFEQPLPQDFENVLAKWRHYVQWT